MPNKSPEPTAGWRCQFRCRGWRRESAVAQLSTLGRIADAMKTITLILLYITLTTAAAWAKDYHLVTTQLRGAPASGTPAEFPVVYVLLAPDISGQLNPMVYKTFDSKDMELDIGVLMRSGIIAPGSVLHFDPKPDLERPTDAQIQSLKDYCKKLGITLVVGQTTVAVDSSPKPELTVKSFSFIGSDTTLKQVFDKIGSPGMPPITSLLIAWYPYRLSDGTDVQIVVSTSDSSILNVVHQDAKGHLIEMLYSKKKK